MMEERLRYLFRQYLDNTCTLSELEEFFGYIKAADHDDSIRQCIRNAYAEIEGSDSLSTHVDEKGRLVLTEPSWINLSSKTEKKPRTKWITKVSLAAFIILMAGSIWVIQNRIGLQKSARDLAAFTKKSTDRSESKYLMLADSTEVWLNAASSLQFPDKFDGKVREVYLSGEAYFDVRHADKIPFIIHTGEISTTVLGTAFNIKAYPGEKNVTVSVSRGKVEVSRKDGWKKLLLVGEQVKLEEEKNEVIEKKIQTSEVAAWQQGTIVYDDETFEDIILDLQRIYNVNIRINNPGLKTATISTSFKKEIGITQALQVLCKLTDTELKQINGDYEIQ